MEPGQGATRTARLGRFPGGVNILNNGAKSTNQRGTGGDNLNPAERKIAGAAQSVGRFASNLLTAISPPAANTVAPKSCRVWTASYGGQKALIIKSISATHVNYTVLDVNDGQERREADAYIAAYAKGGEMVGSYADQTKALAKAFQLCPEGNK